MSLSHHQNRAGSSTIANTRRVVGLVTGVLLWSPSEGSNYLRAPARRLSFPPDGSRVLNAERPLCLPGHIVQGHKYNAVRFIGRFQSPVHPRHVRRLIPTSTSIYGNVYARRYVNPTPIRSIKSNITSEVPLHHSRGCTSSYRAFSNFPTPGRVSCPWGTVFASLALSITGTSYLLSCGAILSAGSAPQGRRFPPTGFQRAQTCSQRCRPQPNLILRVVYLHLTRTMASASVYFLREP